MLRSPTHVRGALLTTVVSVVWALLAIRSPSLTYHFAPIIAAVLWPLSLRSAGSRTAKDAGTAALASGALVTVVAVVLELTGNLEGPTFWNEGPALTEAILFAVSAAAFGARAASRDRPGLLGSLVEQGDR